ncbi:phage holin family protein, partial [Enterococcus cecorum]|uniref:phage holin family protein n=1 Tax=Enterococcus cecorum TaxID=44008 RepID=UPI001FAD3023
CFFFFFSCRLPRCSADGLSSAASDFYKRQGLFPFIVNSMMLVMTANILGENHFSFTSFSAAVIVAVIMSVVNTIINSYHAD